MPVSRNRRKKSNQSSNNKSKAARPMCIHELFEMQFNNSRKCGRARDKFAFDERSDEKQRHWIKSGVKDSIEYLLYCPNYDEYSAILDI